MPNYQSRRDRGSFIAALISRAEERASEALARAVIVAVDSSTRRQVGASLIISGVGVEGSLGGGDLEELVARQAGELMTVALAQGRIWERRLLFVPQGPILGETARGGVHLLIETFGAAEIAALRLLSGRGASAALLARPMSSGEAPLLLDGAEGGCGAAEPLAGLVERLRAAPDETVVTSTMPPRAEGWVVERLGLAMVTFHIHGGGEVAVALARVLAGTPFRPVVHADAAAVAAEVAFEAGAFHAVMTGLHEDDVEVCRQILAADRFGYLGVIGSHLKRAGLLSRLAAAGIAPDAAKRIVCPIGLAPVRGKEPAVIAIAIAAEAIARLRADERAK